MKKSWIEKIAKLLSHSIFAKYYIYHCKFKNIIPNIESFKTKLRNRKTLEQKIALEDDRVYTFTISGEGYGSLAMKHENK